MAADGIESELKLDAAAGFSMPRLDGVLDGVVAVALPERRMTATYVDTADLRLLRSGVTLRHRVEREADGVAVSEWTLKLPLPSEGSLLRRRELRWPGAEDALPAEAELLVRPWRRLAPLAPAARLVSVRQRSELRHAGAAVAEIDDDVVSVMDGPHLAARFRQVEVELAAGAPRRLLPAVVARLEQAGARAGDVRSKVERALGPLASADPDVVVRRCGPKAPLGEVVAHAVGAAWAALAGHHAGVVLGDDPEDAHLARVATRRLRAELRLLRPVLDPAWVVATREDLAWLGRLLGAVRERDVLAARVRRHAARLPEEDRAALEALLGRLAGERAAARAALLGVLGGDRYAAVLDRLAVAACTPPLAVAAAPGGGGGVHAPTPACPPIGAADPGGPGDRDRPDAPDRPDDPDRPDASGDPDATGDPAGRDGQVRPAAAPAGQRARDVLPALVGVADRRFLDTVGGLGVAPGDGELHEVRAAAKAVRYAAELAAGPCGQGARDLAGAAADLQGVLGDLTDAAAACTWLRAAGLEGDAAVALAAGQLLAAEAAAAGEARRAWPRAAKRARRKRLRAWLDGPGG